MAIRKYNPTSPGRRFQTVQVFDEITTQEPHKPLVGPLKRTGGRDKQQAPVVLDSVSRHIIDQLQQDGRRSYAAIGKAVGLSEAAAGVSCLTHALAQAEQALELGERLVGGGRLVRFAELGIHRFLLDSYHPERLEAFHGQPDRSVMHKRNEHEPEQARNEKTNAEKHDRLDHERGPPTRE